jgi:hypothetical protein
LTTPPRRAARSVGAAILAGPERVARKRVRQAEADTGQRPELLSTRHAAWTGLGCHTWNGIDAGADLAAL